MGDSKNEIDEMLKGFSEVAPVETPVVEPPVVEPPSVETPPVEPVIEPEVTPPVEPPVVEPPVVEPPVVEPPVVEPPPVEPPPIEETLEQRAARYEAQNAALLTRIEALSGGPEPAPAAPVAGPKPVEPPVAAPVAPPLEVKVDEVDFLQGRKLDDIIDDPTEFNKLLNTVYRRGVEAGVPLAMERSLLAVPQVVVSQIQRSNVMKGLVDDFYKVNEDLKPVQRTVGLVANEVHSEHTDWTVQQVFDESALRTRKVLGMPVKPVAAPVAPVAPGVVATPKPDTPAFVNVSGSRQRGPAAPKLTGMAKEIEDLMF